MIIANKTSSSKLEKIFSSTLGEYSIPKPNQLQSFFQSFGLLRRI